MASHYQIIEASLVRDAELMELFATPVLQYVWPDSTTLNAQLRKAILSRMEGSAGVVKTNRGGWQSEADLQNWDEDCFKGFLSRVECMVQEMVRRTVPNPDARHLENWNIRAWANVNKTGAFNTPHHHDGPNSLWSGFYYVDLGQLGSNRSCSGRTVFEDRSGVAKEIIRNPDPFEREIAISPQAGRLVMFPARLWHYVEPYSGEGVRITIGFNLWHPGFRVPYYEGMQEPSWWWANFRGLMIIPEKVPEKLRALTLIPKHLLTRRMTRSFRSTICWKHIKTAVGHATAEASALAIQKRTHAKQDKKELRINL